MKDFGEMIYKMEKVLKHGLMVLDMRDIIKKVKNMDKVHIHGVMDLNMLGNGLIIK